MAALLVTLAIMGIAISVAMPVWRTVVQREKEEELIFRGRQYTRAIGLFQRRFANAYPPSFDVLVEQKFLRKKFKDPMTEDGTFEVLYQGSALAVIGARGAQAGTTGRQTGGGSGAFGAGGRSGASGQPGGLSTTFIIGGRGGVGPQGGVIGVASKSTEKSFRILDGRSQYNQWQFIWLPTAGPGRGGGVNQPGGRGGGVNQPGGRAGGVNQPGGRGGEMNQPGGRGGRGEQGSFGVPGFGTGRGRGQGPGGAPQPGSGRGPGT
jgi:type II secretory pathway pseudopilin PulG